MDLTKLSDADLYALQAGDLSKVSDAGLAFLSGQSSPIQTPVKQLAQPTFLENAVGAVTEPLMKMGSAMIAKPVSDVGGIAAMFADYLGIAPNNPVQTKQRIQQAMTYEPRTTAGASEYNPLNAVPQLMGQAASKVTTPVMAAIRGDAAPDTARGMVANAVGEAVPQALNIMGVKGMPAATRAVTQAGAATGEAIAARGARAAEAASNADWQNAARIEAAQLAQKYGIKVVPSETNPTAGNRIVDVAAGNKLYDKIVAENAPKWADLYKQEVGIDTRTPLNAEAFGNIRSKLSAPYGAVSKMNFVDDGNTIASAIRGIEVPDVAVNQGAAPKITGVVDNLVNKLENGMTGKQVLAEIKALQDSARSLMDSNKTTPNSLFVAEAKAKRQMADQLYELILKNVEKNNTPELYRALKEARVKIAQSHVAQDATNLITHRLDPRVIAKDMAEGNTQVTGVLADMGKIAGNFPDVANVSPAKRSLTGTTWSRAGAAGTAGAVLGSMVGMPVQGGALGATLGLLGSYGAQKRVLNPKYQAANAIPPDRRMPIPGEPPAPPVLSLPYVQQGETLGGYTPNWTPGGRTPPASLGSLPYDPNVGRVTPQDLGNTTRVPNDRAMAEYLRAQEAVRIAAEKEAALAKLSDRNAQIAAARESKIAREKLMDAVEQLQERLGGPRPTSSGMQGKKTRAFQRGLLTGENQ